MCQRSLLSNRAGLTREHVAKRLASKFVYSCCGDAASPPPLQTDNALPDSTMPRASMRRRGTELQSGRKGIEPVTSWLQTRNPIPAITAG